MEDDERIHEGDLDEAQHGLSPLDIHGEVPHVKKYLSECRGQVAPAETNPAWRWSYYQPRRELTAYETEMEKMEEDQACRSLLIVFSNALSGAEQFGFPVLSCDDLEHYNLFEWEREIMLRRISKS